MEVISGQCQSGNEPNMISLRYCLIGLVALVVQLLPATVFSSTQSSAQTSTQIPHDLRVCGDVNEWPPFTYYKREGQLKTSAVIGYNVEYLTAMLANSGRSFTISLLPWKRCLNLAAEGEFDLVLDGMKVPAREKYFLFPQSHYSLTAVYLYRSNDHLLKISSEQDLTKFKACGTLGWDASRASTTINYSENQPPTFESSIKMLEAKRCDYLLYDLEVINALWMIDGKDMLSNSKILYSRLSWLTKGDFYIMVSRTVPYRDELVKLIDQGVKKMQESGETDRLWNLYVVHPKP